MEAPFTPQPRSAKHSHCNDWPLRTMTVLCEVRPCQTKFRSCGPPRFCSWFAPQFCSGLEFESGLSRSHPGMTRVPYDLFFQLQSVVQAGKAIYWVHIKAESTLICKNCSNLSTSTSEVATQATKVMFVPGTWPATALAVGRITIAADQVLAAHNNPI